VRYGEGNQNGVIPTESERIAGAKDGEFEGDEQRQKAI
jgi:hypothetical protein